MVKRVIYPQGIWSLFARSRELALRADNKSGDTIWAHIQAVRLRRRPNQTPVARQRPHHLSRLAHPFEMTPRTSAQNHLLGTVGDGPCLPVLTRCGYDFR